jgi:hypothetical protein
VAGRILSNIRPQHGICDARIIALPKEARHQSVETFNGGKNTVETCKEEQYSWKKRKKKRLMACVQSAVMLSRSLWIAYWQMIHLNSTSRKLVLFAGVGNVRSVGRPDAKILEEKGVRGSDENAL